MSKQSEKKETGPVISTAKGAPNAASRGKSEISEQDLEKVAGGVTFEYGALQVKYTPQKPDGTTG